MLFQCIFLVFDVFWVVFIGDIIYVFNESKSNLPLRRSQSFHEHCVVTKCKASPYFRSVVVACVAKAFI